jgi:hypothetical protein
MCHDRWIASMQRRTMICAARHIGAAIARNIVSAPSHGLKFLIHGSVRVVKRLA